MATNSSNTTLDVEVGWQAAPRTRGTADILWNCVTVILLITWTSFYSSVGIGKLRRIFTTLTAILVPELSAMVALRDLLYAYRLRYCFKHAIDRPGWKSGWTLSKSFLVVKGGIVAGHGHTNSSSDASPAETVETEEGKIIDTETFLRLAVMGSILYEDFPTTDQINDKSKADWFSKGAALVQLIWFIVNLICRVNKSCAISVLESMTLDWVIFGVLATMFWWKCPQNINIPFTIPVHNPSITEPSPKRDPNAPAGTLLDYIASFEQAYLWAPDGWVPEDHPHPWALDDRWPISPWSSGAGVLFMVFPVLGHITVQILFFGHYHWHSKQHYVIWRLLFGLTTVAEAAIFYLDPHARTDQRDEHIYFHYLRPLLLQPPQKRGLDKKQVGVWLSLARGMGIYNSTDSKPWRRDAEKTWHEIDLKLLVVTIFVTLLCQSGKLVIAVMAFKSAPQGIYSVPDVPFLEALVHVGG